MNVDKPRELIFCHVCFAIRPARQYTYVTGNEVRCTRCSAVLGYDHDWPEVYNQEVHNG